MDSGKMRIESRWVTRDSNEDDEGGEARREQEEEEGDEVEHRLIRTSPVFDPLDVEALEVSGAPKDELDEVMIRSIIICWFL